MIGRYVAVFVLAAAADCCPAPQAPRTTAPAVPPAGSDDGDVVGDVGQGTEASTTSIWDDVDCKRIDYPPDYKDILVCKPKDTGPNSLTDKEISEGWILLFDGRSLRGWRPHGSGDWKVVDGVLTCEEPTYGMTMFNGRGRIMGWIGTTEVYRDFELKLEYRVPQGGDSGVSIRTSESLASWSEGYEIQILDDATWPGDDPDMQQHYDQGMARPTGSIMGFTKAVYPSGNLPKAGVWNKMEIHAKGEVVTVFINGEKVSEVSVKKESAFAHVTVHETKPTGHIGLQYYFVGKPKSKVEYRGIKIRPFWGGFPLYAGPGDSSWQTDEHD